MHRLDTQFNAFGKIAQMVDYGPDRHRMAFDYGPDNERWRTQLFRDSTTLRRTTYYWGDYEEIVENGVTRKLYYLDGNVLYKKQTNCPDSLFYIFADHLGSVVAILDQNGGEKFRASYDAWGNQTVTRNDLGFHRGYTGHEMLPEFGLINMNGRLYDPAIGRFLSTDNFVQEPWNSQNFNRYSYCLNNPLKYTDPDGEFIHILIGAAIGGIVNLTVKAVNGQINSWGDGFAAFGIGAAAGAVGAATGGVAFALAGGAAGGAGGFIAGAVGGAVGAATSMPIQSEGNHLYFGDPRMSGKEYLIGIGTSALLGGAVNGAIAKMNGRSFLNGTPKHVRLELKQLEPVPIGDRELRVIKFDDGKLGSIGEMSPYDKGQMGVNRAITEFEESGGVLLRREVTVEVDGVRNRFDFVGQKDNVLHFFEVKNGPFARMTHNQAINIPKLQQGASFIPVGKNAAEIIKLKPFVLTKSPFNGDFEIHYIHYE